ncbi:GNAT family N-acetyltransferase [Amycolatopsis pigmentata]|uniref:GNAT family N-acetyltransferase n=1 Tax=Amycolatopsis pigmentata TaxID=450801 RepID=A0ABW5FRK5_9PSEU
MSDYSLRVLRPDEHRAANNLFRSSIHVPPVGDDWRYAERAYQPGRVLGAFDDTKMIGTARSFDAEMTVPGGKRPAVAAVTAVGVRADRTRRGVLTALMRRQFEDFVTRGVPLAALYASEPGIYGRFGYGVATRVQKHTVDLRRARLRPGIPANGEIEVVGVDEMFERLPGIFAELPHTRPGMMTRPEYWWPGFERAARTSPQPCLAAIHHGPDGPDGFVVYTVREDRSALEVTTQHVANSAAFAGLWRFLAGVDLVGAVEAFDRPLDEPAELLFTDPGAFVSTEALAGRLWLRLVDVPAALAAREYDGEPVVLDVADPVLEANSGRYLVSPDRVAVTTEPAGLRLDVSALAMLYLGTWSASALAAAGWIEEVEPGAAARADRLFRTEIAAWCGTRF